ncbi:hypothetical protein OV203_45650 [Nannocystis sp. ILAH1]|uniref:hypothetical protein n=1 Tax=unclassified Nannocystis TaxID=2627009 RepID=UPI00226E1307|nr:MULTISPECIES: hypothetical protein [unclassified Nannocystis]MCY0994495.1 hypothetical protein [Nannocystis sp. ILAH1]MCY1063583.1 hypothetical protein [Nannocystis sp. RBIL2]
MKTIYLGFAVVLASAACGDSGGNGSTSSPGTGGDTNPGPGSSDGETIPQADCTSRCEAHATACDVPEAMVSQLCGNICADSLTEAAIQCIEALPCTAGEDELDECTSKNPPGGSSESDGPTDTGGPSAGGFGDPCTCGMTSGEWECSGSNICATGLVCVGVGNDAGTCRGPVCCDSESDCAERLGKQANCDTGQKCACQGGNLECVGEACTCEGGALTNRGLCYPE